MKSNFKQLLFGTIATGIILTQTNIAAAKTNVSDYILEPMPTWYAERFTSGNLDINKMIKDGYTRLEAIEIQNQMKDILDTDPEYSKQEIEGKDYDRVKIKDSFVTKALETAITNVKEKKIFESGFKPEPLKDNEFYVVFDLDETLLVQWYEAGKKGPLYYDFKVNSLDNILHPVLVSPDYVSLIPGFEKALKEVSRIPGNKGIIFFSAKLDPATYEVVNKITIDGKPIRNFLKGLFTRNYLVREQDPTKLSKDLRMVDETLKHVILIDDNPTRVLEKQKKNLREFPQYNPDDYLKAKNETKDKTISSYFENLLPVVVSEIKEAEEYAIKNHVSFIDAYYPYSMPAQAKILMLQKQGASLNEAINQVRKNPKLFESKFFFYEVKGK